MKRAYIFGGGIYGDEFPVISPGDMIIAADKGCEKLKEKGIEPHITIGDFDSSSFIPEKNAVILPVEKDVTDSHAACDKALENGCDEIYIYGGMGGRPDHTFANYALIAGLTENGIKAFLVGEGYEITAVTDGEITLTGEKGKTVSVFSWSALSEGISYTGLKYPLTDAALSKSFAMGVSNSFEEEMATVQVKKGTLIVMKEL